MTALRVGLADDVPRAAADVAALVGTEETEAVELVVRLSRGRVIVFGRDAQECGANRHGHRLTDATTHEEAGVTRREQEHRGEAHVVDGLFGARGPLVAPAVVGVVLDAHELRRVAVREVVVRVGVLDEEGHRLLLPLAAEVDPVLEEREGLRVVHRPVDADVVTLVPTTVRGVLDEDVRPLAGQSAVRVADVHVVIDRESRQRLATELGVATVVVAAVDQLVAAIGIEEVLVHDPADTADRSGLPAIECQVGERAAAVEHVDARGAADLSGVPIRVDHGLENPPLTLEDALVDQVGLNLDDIVLPLAAPGEGDDGD